MSAPRRPIGRHRPGTIPATRLKVLAAEITDPLQLRRGKLLFADDAVVDLEETAGVLVVLVQGPAPQPVRVELINAVAGSVPDRSGLSWRCGCRRGEPGGAPACEHVVAAIFSVADHVSIDPALVARWGDAGGDEHTDDRDDRGDCDDRDDIDDADGPRDSRGSRGSRDREPGRASAPARVDTVPDTVPGTVPGRSFETSRVLGPETQRDPIGHLLVMRAPLPDIPVIERVDFASTIVGGDDGLVDEPALRHMLERIASELE